MRYVPYNGQVPSIVPDWVRAKPSRPRVCVTLGMTVRNSAMPNMVSVDEVFRAVKGLDVEVVATLSAQEQELLADVPDNVRIVEHVPLDALLPTCSAVVHHGGIGSWATAAALGVPQLSLGHMWESIYRAQRTEALGAGLGLYSSDLTAEGLRERLVRLLTDPSYARGAAALRDVIQAAPSPNDAVPVLEKLTAERR
jgi:glycosyltransferase